MKRDGTKDIDDWEFFCDVNRCSRKKNIGTGWSMEEEKKKVEEEIRAPGHSFLLIGVGANLMSKLGVRWKAAALIEGVSG